MFSLKFFKNGNGYANLYKDNEEIGTIYSCRGIEVGAEMVSRLNLIEDFSIEDLHDLVRDAQSHRARVERRIAQMEKDGRESGDE